MWALQARGSGLFQHCQLGHLQNWLHHSEFPFYISKMMPVIQSTRPRIRTVSKMGRDKAWQSASIQCIRPTRHYRDAFISVFLPNNHMRCIFLTCPCYGWDDSSSEKLNKRPRSSVSEVLTGGAQGWFQFLDLHFTAVCGAGPPWPGSLGSTVLGWLMWLTWQWQGEVKRLCSVLGTGQGPWSGLNHRAAATWVQNPTHLICKPQDSFPVSSHPSFLSLS